jgi:hypothetical protein
MTISPISAPEFSFFWTLLQQLLDRESLSRNQAAELMHGWLVGTKRAILSVKTLTTKNPIYDNFPNFGAGIFLLLDTAATIIRPRILVSQSSG